MGNKTESSEGRLKNTACPLRPQSHPYSNRPTTNVDTYPSSHTGSGTPLIFNAVSNYKGKEQWSYPYGKHYGQLFAVVFLELNLTSLNVSFHLRAVKLI